METVEVVEGFTSSSVHAEMVKAKKETSARIVKNFFIFGLGLSFIIKFYSVILTMQRLVSFFYHCVYFLIESYVHALK